MLLRSMIWVAATATLAGAAPVARGGPQDADTAAWWGASEALSSDAMEGRDTGSPGYDRAARLLAAKFAAAGLVPAGDRGGWYQQLAFTDLAVERRGTSLRIGAARLRFLHDFTLRPSTGMPRSIAAAVAYRGYCAAGSLGDVRGKLVLCHGWRRAGLTSAADRLAAVTRAGAAGMLTIADPGFTVEPMRWPVAYARSVAPIGAVAPGGDALLIGTLNPEALARVVAGSRQDAAALLRAGSAGAPLPSFDLAARANAQLSLRQGRIQSANILGMLPGRDPALRGEFVVLSAHLDGYGRGEPVNGDGLYNGTLDDAAYVALLQRLAERRRGRGYRRSVIFAAFTGEEKGLLGASAFVAAPPVGRGAIVANVNLDQLRPIFPLDLLTVHALDDTSLGDAVRTTAAGMSIAVQRDPEPERNLLRRADHWPFLEAGIPATGFVFGYRAGTDAERRYRLWYETRYHKPQDDAGQPMDWRAAAKFNAFFYALVERVADADRAPQWKPGSELRRR